MGSAGKSELSLVISDGQSCVDVDQPRLLQPLGGDFRAQPTEPGSTLQSQGSWIDWERMSTPNEIVNFFYCFRPALCGQAFQGERYLGFVDTIAEVAGIAVLHDDAQAVLVEEGVYVAHDIRVRHSPQKVNLISTRLLLLDRDILELHNLQKATPTFIAIRWSAPKVVQDCCEQRQLPNET